MIKLCNINQRNARFKINILIQFFSSTRFENLMFITINTILYMKPYIACFTCTNNIYSSPCVAFPMYNATHCSWCFVYWFINLECMFVISCVFSYCTVCTAVLHTVLCVLLSYILYWVYCCLIYCTACSAVLHTVLCTAVLHTVLCTAVLHTVLGVLLSYILYCV